MTTLLAAAAAPPAANALPADSVSVRWELGASSDLSNEQYYEEQFTDTTFLGRQLLSAPEYRSAAVLGGELFLGSHGGGWGLRVRPDVVLGDRLRRAGVTARWRRTTRGGWDARIDPELRIAHDRSFGVDRHEALAAATVRLSRPLGLEQADVVGASAGAEVYRVGKAVGLAHDVFRAGLLWEHLPVLGWEWRVGHQMLARTFPDSSARDHTEQQFSTTFRHELFGGNWVSLNLDGDLRTTMRPQVSTRDRFHDLRAQVDLSLPVASSTSLRVEFGAEATRFADPDSAIDFDYEVQHASLMLRRELGASWSLLFGPRAEILSSGQNVEEQYREVGLSAEVEQAGAHAWWIVTPAGGWRTYDAIASSTSASDFDAQALHSSYSFLDLQLVVEQSLPRGLRVRVLGNGRVERHKDASQDARSLYFSVDARRLF